MNTRSSTAKSAAAAIPASDVDPARTPMADEEQAAQFRVLSDLHLEFYGSVDALLASIPWNRDCDAHSFLLLAGDVGYPLGAQEGGKYRALLTALAARFRGIFLVAGNHEYYQCAETPATMDEVDAALDALCRSLHRPSRPVVFLQKQAWTLLAERSDGAAPHATQLLGCSMWSPVSAAASMQMNDRTYMGVEAPWIRALHTEHVGWLRRSLSASIQNARKQSTAATPTPPPPPVAAAATKTVVIPAEEEEEGGQKRRRSMLLLLRRDGSIVIPSFADRHRVFDRRVVMTHHLPTGAPPSTTAFGHLVAAASRDSAYYADLFRRSDSWPEDAWPDLWVCGHLHAQERRQVGRTEVISCCHGYSVGQLAEASRMDELAWRPSAPVYCRDAAKLIRETRGGGGGPQDDDEKQPRC
jgi:hypothetical protein